MKKAIIIVVSFSFLFILIFFSGCVIRKVPYDAFNSLLELQDSMDNDVLFPDTEGYIFKDDAMYSKDYTGKTNVAKGYYFGGNLNMDESITNLWALHFSCRLLETAYDERNPAPSIDTNTRVLETDVYEKIVEESDDPNVHALGWYPDGSKIINYSYEFDYKSCRYTVSGTLVIPPDRLNNLDGQEVDDIVESSKNEVLDLVKSIIDQEGKQ